MSETLKQFDILLLNESSTRFASKLFERYPEYREFAQMRLVDDSDEYCLVVEISSPTNDTDLDIGIWMQNGVEPSLGFGPSHTHSKVEMVESNLADENEAILSLLDRIIKGSIVVSTDIGGQYDGHKRWLNLDKSNAVTDYLTDKYSPNQIKLQSWSGSIDKLESLNELKI